MPSGFRQRAISITLQLQDRRLQFAPVLYPTTWYVHFVLSVVPPGYRDRRRVYILPYYSRSMRQSSPVMMTPRPWVSYCGRPARPNICMTSSGPSSCQAPFSGLYTCVPLMITICAGRFTPHAKVAVDTNTCRCGVGILAGAYGVRGVVSDW